MDPLIPAAIGRLPELESATIELSTGLALEWQGQLVFGLDPRAVPLGGRRPACCLAYVGVGGHLEPGEGWCAAVTREAAEEAACAILLEDSPQTFLCREGQAPQALETDWGDTHRPLLIWLATFRLPRGPQRVSTPVTFVNAVFRAHAQDEPRPAAEMAALLLLDEASLLATYAEPQPLGALLARGARLIGALPPADTLLAPGGSAYFLAQWLSHRR